MPPLLRTDILTVFFKIKHSEKFVCIKITVQLNCDIVIVLFEVFKTENIAPRDYVYLFYSGKRTRTLKRIFSVLIQVFHGFPQSSNVSGGITLKLTQKLFVFNPRV